jgi:hypothetical protein
MCNTKIRVEKAAKNVKKDDNFLSEKFHFNVTLRKDCNAVKLLSLNALLLFSMLFCEWGYIYTRTFALGFLHITFGWHAWLVYGKGSGLQAHYYLSESDRPTVQFPRKPVSFVG